MAKIKGFSEEEKIKSKVYEKYEEYLTSNQYLDFDDLMLKAVDILKRFPLVKDKWKEKFELAGGNKIQEELQRQIDEFLVSKE